ncbi:MAG: lipid-A-disaccharide synthase N-terminal domain-containing protein [Kiritimatiellae bacterium]|nr:lipid-A-disaccharide synthase N-terminal domain-containing protein [Kiritimatiellia bacterium]
MKSFIAELSHPMVILGYLGQALFFSRFLVQWIASERKGQSTVPVVFWYLSIGGGALLLFYALWRKDQVIILGQLVGVFVYVRNLMLIRRHKAAAAGPAAG